MGGHAAEGLLRSRHSTGERDGGWAEIHERLAPYDEAYSAQLDAMLARDKKAMPPGRKCALCGRELRRENRSGYCWPCQRADSVLADAIRKDRKARGVRR